MRIHFLSASVFTLARAAEYPLYRGVLNFPDLRP